MTPFEIIILIVLYLFALSYMAHWFGLFNEHNTWLDRVKEKPTAIVNCPHCGSKLEIESSDIFWYKQIDGDRSPGVTCAVCHKGFDVEGYINKLL